MGFGLWKKIKKGVKQAGAFIKTKALPILKDVGKAAISTGITAITSGGNINEAIKAGGDSIKQSFIGRAKNIDWDQFKLEPQLKSRSNIG